MSVYICVCVCVCLNEKCGAHLHNFSEVLLPLKETFFRWPYQNYSEENCVIIKYHIFVTL